MFKTTTAATGRLAVGRLDDDELRVSDEIEVVERAQHAGIRREGVGFGGAVAPVEVVVLVTPPRSFPRVTVEGDGPSAGRREGAP